MLVLLGRLHQPIKDRFDSRSLSALRNSQFRILDNVFPDELFQYFHFASGIGVNLNCAASVGLVSTNAKRANQVSNQPGREIVKLGSIFNAIGVAFFRLERKLLDYCAEGFNILRLLCLPLRFASEHAPDESSTFGTLFTFASVNRYPSHAVEVQEVMDREGNVVGPIHDLGNGATLPPSFTFSHPRKHVLLSLVVTPLVLVFRRPIRVSPWIFKYSVQRAPAQIEPRYRDIVWPASVTRR